MATMIRKQIYLDEASDKALRAEARRRGMSQAAVIRERLTAAAAAAPAVANPAAREWLLERLRKVRESAGHGPGTGWRFDRDEVYAERLEKARPARHERPDQRGRRTRTG